MPRKHRPSLKNRIRSEWQCTSKLTVSVCTVVAVLAGVYFAVLADGFASYPSFCLPDGAPPVFFLPFLWVWGFFLLGASAGICASVKEKHCLHHKKRGLWFILAVFATILLWAPVFFRFELFFIGIILLCIAIISTIFATLEILTTSRIASILMLLFWLWLLFLLYLNLAILFLN